MKSKSFRNLASKSMKKAKKKKKKNYSCQDLNPGHCAWQVGMLTTILEQIIQIITRFLVITISKQIFEAKFLKLLLLTKKI